MSIAKFARTKGAKDKKKRRSLLQVVSGGRFGNPKRRSLSDNIIGTTTAGRVARGAGVLGAASIGTALLLRKKGVVPVSTSAVSNGASAVVPVAKVVPSSAIVPSQAATRIYPQPINQESSTRVAGLLSGRSPKASSSGGKAKMIPGREQTSAPPQVGDYMGGKRRTYRDAVMDGLRNMKEKVIRALPPGKKRSRGRPKKKFQA